MSLIENVKQLGKGMLDLVFPISCLVCGADGTYLCQSCLAKLPKLEQQQCLVCQKPSPFGKTHPECRTRNSVDGAIAALSHKDPKVQEIIRTFKYNFVSDLAVPLAKLTWQELQKQELVDYFCDFVLVPVPLHPRRSNWRGFNQAELLGHLLSVELKTKIDKTLVIRKKFTAPQTRLKAEERKRNIENAFSLIGDVSDKKILLVDDVVTSGSTANELAKLLKSAHAQEVWLITTAHG